MTETGTITLERPDTPETFRPDDPDVCHFIDANRRPLCGAPLKQNNPHNNLVCKFWGHKTCATCDSLWDTYKKGGR